MLSEEEDSNRRNPYPPKVRMGVECRNEGEDQCHHINQYVSAQEPLHQIPYAFPTALDIIPNLAGADVVVPLRRQIIEML